MPKPNNHSLRRHADQRNSRCLSCGTRQDMNGRKYCSIRCRQRLRRQLNLRTGLLKALNTRYATFYFTHSVIVLDVLPYDSRQIFSFIYPRRRQFAPADDFRRMANRLGNDWWAERRRTHRRYLATRHLLDNAERRNGDPDAVQPIEEIRPSLNNQSLIRLRLNVSDLSSEHLSQRVKSAFRKQALRLHPDKGGNAAAFRRLHQAYQQLADWAEHPSYSRRRGFPDKWFYNGSTNRWVQPTPGQN